MTDGPERAAAGRGAAEDDDLPSLLRQAIEAYDSGDYRALARVMAQAYMRLFEVGIETALGAGWEEAIVQAASEADWFGSVIRAVNSLDCRIFPAEREAGLHKALSDLDTAIAIRAAEGGAERTDDELRRLLEAARAELSQIVGFMHETTHPIYRGGRVQ